MSNTISTDVAERIAYHLKHFNRIPELDALEAIGTITTLRVEVERLTMEGDESFADAARAETLFNAEEISVNNLGAELFQAEAERDAAIARADKAEAALAKMREALAPFAIVSMGEYSPLVSDDAWVELKGFELIDGGTFVPAKAFRRARETLASLTEGEPT